MKRKRFTEEEIIGILNESDQARIQAPERYGDPQAVPQRIASIGIRPESPSGATCSRCCPGTRDGQERIGYLHLMKSSMAVANLGDPHGALITTIQSSSIYP